MAQIAILERKCTGCGLCVQSCPFGAIDMKDGKAEINAGCKVCGICLKVCPEKAILRLETKVESVDKSLWKDILVFAEVSGGRLHPVSLELIGKARELAKGVPGFTVKAALVGDGVTCYAEELRHYGVSQVDVYDDPALSYFRADAFTACLEDCIRKAKPSVVLVGATSLGRSLAPRLATRFHTGLTADCTRLELRENTDLVQIRPAFGGNIMAQITTEHTRPQFATVRYKVMDAPQRQEEAGGEVVVRAIPKAVGASPVTHVSTVPVPAGKTISDAEILVVAGRGMQKEGDLEMIRELAGLLGGDWAVSRPLVEKGWTGNAKQIGLSGRTVRPKLLIACGVSGAIQFTASMNAAEHIIAINSDPDAPIFQVAHIAIVGDLYQILPELIQELKREGPSALDACRTQPQEKEDQP
ncbi:MAG: electron transfer flavoprotein subunit alpha [Candidatus Limiplasma sp.]|nr:electron transfer flavoprotein subunit alpha [Candidatus Limiplasma sp.]